MWTAELIEKTKEQDRFRLVVKYTNGTETIEEAYYTDFPGADYLWLRNTAKDRIDHLEDFDTQDFPLGMIDLQIEPPVEDLTPEQVQNGQYQDKLEELRKKNALVALGVIDASELKDLQVETKQLAIDLGEI